MDDFVSMQRQEGNSLVIRVVSADRVPAMIADGWAVKPETDWVPEHTPQFNVQQPLYADMAYNVRDLKEGQRVPLSGTRKQQLGEAQRIADRKFGEGKVEAQW